MSTLVKQLRTSVRIPASFKIEVLEAIKKMPGMERNLDLCPDNHFEWIDFKIVDGKPHYLFEDVTCLEDALSFWNWLPRLDDSGNIVDLIFLGNCSGDEDVLFAVIAPWVESGSFIEMINEDGCRFRYDFVGGEMVEVNLKKVTSLSKLGDWDSFWKGKESKYSAVDSKNGRLRITHATLKRKLVSFTVEQVEQQSSTQKSKSDSDFLVFVPKEEGLGYLVFRVRILRSTKQFEVPYISFVVELN